MLNADLLYNLNLRLQEIMQNDLDFGGVSVWLCGDLMQLKPVQAAWIFANPKKEQYQAAHMLHPLWEQFEPVVLTVNHWQAGDSQLSFDRFYSSCAYPL